MKMENLEQKKPRIFGCLGWFGLCSVILGIYLVANPRYPDPHVPSKQADRPTRPSKIPAVTEHDEKIFEALLDYEDKSIELGDLAEREQSALRAEIYCTKQAELWTQTYLRGYKKDLCKRYGITLEQLDKIQMRGVLGGWGLEK